MLGSRWVSTFTVIGVILIGLGIVGLVLGPRFVYDPGQPVMGKEAWCYLAVGILMVVNGLLTPPPQPEDKPAPTKTGKPASHVRRSAQGRQGGGGENKGKNRGLTNNAIGSHSVQRLWGRSSKASPPGSSARK